MIGYQCFLLLYIKSINPEVWILNSCDNVFLAALTNCAPVLTYSTTSSAAAAVRQIVPTLWHNSSLSPPSIFSTREADNAVRWGGVAAAAGCQVRTCWLNQPAKPPVPRPLGAHRAGRASRLTVGQPVPQVDTPDSQPNTRPFKSVNTPSAQTTQAQPKSITD